MAHIFTIASLSLWRVPLISSFEMWGVQDAHPSTDPPTAPRQSARSDQTALCTFPLQCRHSIRLNATHLVMVVLKGLALVHYLRVKRCL